MNSTPTTETLNRKVARQVAADAQNNPQSPYAGKYVGIANGRIVSVADSLDDMTRQLRNAEPDPKKTFWIEASADYNEVHQVWSTQLCLVLFGRFEAAGRSSR